MAKRSTIRAPQTPDARRRRWCRALPGLVLTAPLSGCVLHRALLQPAPSPPAPIATTADRSALAPVRATVDPNGPKADPDIRPTAVQVADPNPAPTPAPTPTPTATAAGAPEAVDPSIDPAIRLDPTIPATPVYPLDLATALRLADSQNPQLAEARTLILGALGEQIIARTLLLPTLNAGFNYHGHNGVLQRSSGTILPLSEQSFYIGGGSRTLAAETLAFPAVNISTQLTDAIFEPLAARQRVSSTRFHAAATANEILREVADLYLDLLGAEAVLEAQRLNQRQQADLVRIVGSFARAGEGRRADADRATTDLRLRNSEVIEAEQEVFIASARLSRQLNLDTAVQLRPILMGLEPIHLVDAEAPVEALLQTALSRRPELGAKAANVGVAEAKWREEIYRPFLPMLWLGFSGGAFGGGSNLTPTLLGNFGGRTDFDVRIFWTAQNFGLGNVNLIRRRRAVIGESVADQARMINQVRREVAAARAESLARRREVEIARRELESSSAGYNEDLRASRQNIIRPLEVLNSLNLLAGARLNFIRAVIRYNQAQIDLFVSLGSPPPLPGPPAPLPAPPLTNPLHMPFVADLNAPPAAVVGQPPSPPAAVANAPATPSLATASGRATAIR